jgi:glycine/D-amino acid oxidase-like deaminating enzyme
LRSTDDGRLLIGGEDSKTNHSFFQNRIKERKSEKLEKHLKKILPDLNFIEDFSWGGTFGTTKDGLPYIGKSPEFEHALFVLGYGGNGIVFSVQGMDIICDLLEGKENQLSRYYRFGR